MRYISFILLVGIHPIDNCRPHLPPFSSFFYFDSIVCFCLLDFLRSIYTGDYFLIGLLGGGVWRVIQYLLQFTANKVLSSLPSSE